MSNTLNDIILNSLRTSFLDGSNESSKDYRAQFLSNNVKEGRTVRSVIEDELITCHSFDISVAFISYSGIQPLLGTLEELQAKGVKGRILTTDYLVFSDPKALQKLNSFTNIDVRMYMTSADEGFHTKRYIFRDTDTMRVILGSSNWTQSALTTNREWNTKIISKSEGEFATLLSGEFELLWGKSHPLDEIIEQYEEAYKKARLARKKLQNEIERSKTDAPLITPSVTPNNMQETFIKSLLELKRNGETRSLLISATGTGKTYAAAFAAKNFKPKRVLFLVHREQIANTALRSFQRVIGNAEHTFGILSGTKKEFDRDFVFSTVQTMSMDDKLQSFDKKTFDLIIIDEVHRAGANSYQKIMNYFEPDFWLGMTASPDRTDGFDIYKLFHNNIAYEIRLQTALEEDLLCPFHYFGISDLEVDETKYDLREFSFLTSEERVKHVLQRIDFIGYVGERVKGLIFCSRKEECVELSRMMNERGYKTVALSGDDSQEAREIAVERLTRDDNPLDQLDYIITVDIFNEGVDIPEVNQIVMLRPTQSAIIFVQQLGRGLRKSPGKESVTVIDFIGNYNQNFLIPVALSGDNSLDKDKMRRFVVADRKRIPGASTIYFDQVSRQKIYQAIDTARTRTLQLLRDAYRQLKFKLGRIPDLCDYDKHNSIDPIKFIERSGSYHNFLKEIDRDYKRRLSVKSEKILEYASTKLGNAKRISEVLILEMLLAGKYDNLISQLRKTLKRDYDISVTELHLNNVVKVLTNLFARNKDEQNKFAGCVFIEEDGKNDYCISQELLKAFEKEEFTQALQDLVSFIKIRHKRIADRRYKDTDLVLYEKYSYDDVCRLLNWDTNMPAQNIGGYFYESTTGTLPVFINYDKAEGAISYEDRFLSEQELIALSKTKRSVTSSDAMRFYKREGYENTRIFLFVRKNKDDKEAKAFYFLGEIDAIGEPKPLKLKNAADPEKTDDVFEIHYRLDRPVPKELYEYITSEET